jgi:hypothetical protein
LGWRVGPDRKAPENILRQFVHFLFSAISAMFGAVNP